MLPALILAAAEVGKAVEEKTTNPILPATNEIIWGALSFIVLFFLLKKFAYPAVAKGMEARSERIRADLAAAEAAKTEAQAALDGYKSQLADAKAEGARIVDAARQDAEQVRQNLRREADAEIAHLKRRAQDDIAAQASRAMADVQARVTLLSIELAERVVEANLDRDTNRALVERFISQVGGASSS